MKKSILVVDDELEVAQAVGSILEDEGYEVFSAGDGREAQEALKRKLPDLIITDIMMPHCNGYDLLRLVKSDDTYKNIPVVLMSAAQLKEIEVQPQNFLKKPFNLESLLLAVEKILGKGK